MLKKKKSPGWSIAYSQGLENPEILQAMLSVGDFVKHKKKNPYQTLKSIFILQNTCLQFYLNVCIKNKNKHHLTETLFATCDLR